jgi:hypothetical protein
MDEEFKLPTLADYIDIEELSNIEETEAAFYEASKIFTW